MSPGLMGSSPFFFRLQTSFASPKEKALGFKRKIRDFLKIWEGPLLFLKISFTLTLLPYEGRSKATPFIGKRALGSPISFFNIYKNHKFLSLNLRVAGKRTVFAACQKSLIFEHFFWIS